MTVVVVAVVIVLAVATIVFRYAHLTIEYV